jgi:hypothetical protein
MAYRVAAPRASTCTAGAAGASRSAGLARDPCARAAHLYAAGGRSSHGRVLRSNLVQQRGCGCRGCAAPARRPAASALYQASWGEEAPAPERAQTVSAGRSRRTCRTSWASHTRPASWAPFAHTALHSIRVSCFECQAVQHHYATECPSRFVRVRESGSGGGRGEAIRNIHYSDRQPLSCLQGTILAPTPARPPRPAAWLKAIRHFG